MELQINTKDLSDHVRHVSREDGWNSKDELLIVSLIGIMERLERLQGAVLSLQK
jgi:hypothetical protein